MPNLKNPIEYLQAEHKLLLEAVHTGFKLQQVKDNTTYRSLMHDMIIVLRNYTEIYHYPKEEYILYPLLRGRSKELSQEFLHILFDNHEDFRALMSDMEKAYELYDYEALRKVSDTYLKTLAAHIKEEDDTILKEGAILLSGSEKDVIAKAFVELDEKDGEKDQLLEMLYKINLQLS